MVFLGFGLRTKRDAFPSALASTSMVYTSDRDAFVFTVRLYI